MINRYELLSCVMPWYEPVNPTDWGKKELQDEETEPQRDYMVDLSEASKTKITALDIPLSSRWVLCKTISFSHMECNPVLMPRQESHIFTENPAVGFDLLLLVTQKFYLKS